MKHLGCVRPKTYPSSDLSECWCPLIDRHIEPCSIERKRRSETTYSTSCYYQLFAHKRLEEGILLEEMVNLRHSGDAACSENCGALALAAFSLAIVFM